MLLRTVMGGDFIKNRRLELAFLQTWNLPLPSFFLFFVLISFTNRHCIIGSFAKERELTWKRMVFGKCVDF